MATTSISLSAPPLVPIFKPKLTKFSLPVNYLSPPITSTFSLSAPLPERTRTIQFRNQIWRISATPEEALSSVTNPVEDSLQILPSTSDDGTATIIQVLLFISFAVLSVLTIGVIYLAVTDFLQKRESEKFEKEEATKNKKGRKKKKVRARAGPKGFGQKIDDDDDLDFD
ncbi:hypothetical protein HS088_TW07G00159 [Tripterygium wilfordii]|uniref:Transmembrane protein n=1 Tax=Tripterygium wilfordii TaxID=458696 RepID=A0A7J7DE67_TRIWF|nr:uncharacterized protein LOC120001695 [Tripterygium wilfordii]KAF5744584.1 hypothetical protein HS088_TW07G00159 [Tripterygium wilfordii]